MGSVAHLPAPGDMPRRRKHKTTRKRLRADSLTFDEQVNRAPLVAHVRKLRQALDLDALGVIIVSQRADGSHVILAGQHRILALIEEGMGEWEPECLIYHDLTQAEEAGIARKNNTQKPNSAWDDYRLGIEQGDPECLAMEKIAERAGLRVALQTGQGLISCVAAMRTIFRTRAGTGPAALGFALSTAVAAWGSHTDSVDGHIVNGLGTLYLRYGEEIDRQAFIRKLSKYQGGAPGLLGQAKGLRAMRPGTIGSRVAIIALDIYNRGRRDPLPPL